MKMAKSPDLNINKDASRFMPQTIDFEIYKNKEDVKI